MEVMPSEATLLIHANRDDCSRLLIRHDQNGHLRLGSAKSHSVVQSIEGLADWVWFADYIMEGFVRYELRVREVPAAIELDVRCSGSNRDQYVVVSLLRYIRDAGLNAEVARPLN